MVKRELTADTIAPAEEARSLDQLEAASDIIAQGLQLDKGKLAKDELNDFALDSVQATLLVVMIQIYVNAMTGRANKSFLPSEVLSHLTAAAEVGVPVYRHPALQDLMMNTTVDHLGNEYYFWPEQQRQFSKLLIAGSVLFDQTRRKQLLYLAEETQLAASDFLPVTHPVKPLLEIELVQTRVIEGKSIDKSKLLRDFQTVIAEYRASNPHRVASVALTVNGIGESLSDKSIQKAANEVLAEVLKEHPEWRFMKIKNMVKNVFRGSRDRAISQLRATLPEEEVTLLHLKLIPPEENN